MIKNLRYIVVVIAVINLSANYSAAAQSDDISLYGVVRDHANNKKIPNVDIIVYENGSKVFERKTNLNGKYDFILNFDKFYKIVYNYPNYVSKYLTIDVRDIPEIERKGGFEMNIDMTLFKEIDGLDVSLLDDPIGKAQFDPKRGEMSWDMAYTNMMQKKIRDLMRKHDEKSEQEATREEKEHDDFSNLVRLGDAGMKNREYDDAVGYYTEALSIFPGDEEVNKKLNDARDAAALLAAEREQKDKYDAFIKKADMLYNKSDWSDALVQYQSASGVFPNEEYPKTRIENINKKLEDQQAQKQLEIQIATLLSEGDDLVESRNFDEGIGKYQAVLAIVPDHSEAKRKITVAGKKRDQWLAEKEKEAEYITLVSQGDSFFNNKNYSEAIEKYRKATFLKPEEEYPSEQIKKANELISLAAAQAAKEESFREIVDKGDAKVAKEEYQDGIGFYNQALGIFPDNTEVQSKIIDAEAKIAALLAAEEAARKLKELNDRFDGLVQDGDNAFESTNYNDAIGFYQQALDLKSGDAIVQAKIDDANKALGNLLAAKQLDEKYAEAIRLADKDFKNQQYEGAINYYKQALGLKENEEYPQNKLLEIDAILTKIASDEEAERLKAIEDKFNALVIKGDEFVRTEDYSSGISTYQEALEIKPGDANVQTKIDDAKALQKEKMDALALDDQYAALIVDADNLFKSESWESAKSKYNEAYQLKNEQYPLDKINEIDLKLIALAEALKNKKEAERLEMFNKLESEGDDAVALSDYSGGIAKYNEALLIFADNDRVIEKISNANKLLEETNNRKDLDRRFNDLIASADMEFNNQAYHDARNLYQEAINLKEDQQYPKDKIDEIDIILLQLESKKVEEEKTDTFAQLESEGDEKVEEELYSEAIDKYDQALEIYPEDTRVQQKAGKARQLLKTAKSSQELDAMYNGFISEADVAFGAEEYHDARRNYQQAFALKPMEYPKEKIGEIDKILLELEKQKIQDEMDRLAAMQIKDDDDSWDENISDEEKYIRDAQRIKDENENMKYEELLAYKAAIRNTREDYQETGDINRSGNASVINEEKNVSNILYDDRKKEDDQRQIAEVRMVKEMDKRWVKQMKEEQQQRAQMSDKTEEYEKYQRNLAEKHREVILSNYDNSKDAKQIRYKKFSEKESIRQKNIDEVNNQKNGLATFYINNGQKQQKHIQSELEDMQSVKNTKENNFIVGQELAESNYNNLLSEQELRNMETKSWKEKSDLKRSVALDEVNSKKWPGEKKPYDYYPKEKAQSYQQGVTEEVIDEGKNKVVRRIVVVGNKVDEYKMVVTNHGTYYFKNDNSISKNTWNLSTENVNVAD